MGVGPVRIPSLLKDRGHPGNRSPSRHHPPVSHLGQGFYFLAIRAKMALEWVVLGYAAGAEAIMLLFLTIPGLDLLRKGLISVIRSLLRPFLSVVPFCLFLLMDIYWKYETRPSCESDNCSPSEHLRHEKSIMKSQRNALLIAAALVFYWLLYSVTGLVVRLDQLNKQLEKLKSRD